MKIIDADKLHYKQVYIATEKGTRPALVVFAKEIRKMPEIVRCKDCRWFENDGYHTNCQIMRFCVEAKDYCSRGERRKDEKTD